VLNACANSKDSNGLDRAERLLDRMIGGDIPNVKPDVVSFNTVINAGFKAGDRSRAENVLQQMRREGVAPDDITRRILLARHKAEWF
jgi:pentatricopeptide repeat protein